MAFDRPSQHAFFGVSALLFVASTAVTLVWCASMSAIGELQMPGGWALSMAWMRMPGQTWPGGAAAVPVGGVGMVVPMLMPTLTPILLLYRQGVGRTDEARL